MFEALDKHVDDIARETKKIGLVILRGAGAEFLGGLRHERGARAGQGARQSRIFTPRSSSKIANLPQPVISAVQGHCSTGALELALAADLIVASESAQILRRLCALGPDAGVGPEPAGSRTASAPPRRAK